MLFSHSCWYNASDRDHEILPVLRQIRRSSVSILFIHEVHVVGGNQLYIIYGQCGSILIHPLLLLWWFVGIGRFCLVALQLQVVIVTEHPLVPLHRLPGVADLAAVHFGRSHLPAGGGDDQPRRIVPAILVDADGSKSLGPALETVTRFL